MLHLKRLHLTNFGPFKGDQKIDFPEGPGVSVFYGENMRGKTTLLNAIRFALFGQIKGRGRRDISLEDMINLEAKVDGARGFEVRLEMTHAGADYRLTRTARASATAEGEYEAGYYLERGGHILPPEQARQEIQRILPDQIARFFLFDGELLQEYEDLLDTESDTGQQISQAIERILGLPILTGARDSSQQALERAEKDQALAAQGDQKTRELGTQLAALTSERDVIVADLARHDRDLVDRRARKLAIEEDMRRRERMAALLDKRDRLKDEMDAAITEHDGLETQLKTMMSPAWVALIRPRLLASVATLRQEETELQAAATRAQVLHSLTEGHDPDCPTCLQTVGKVAQAKIRALAAEDASGLPDRQPALAALRRRLAGVEDQLAQINPGVVALKWADLEKQANIASSRRSSIEEINKSLTGDAEDELRSLRRDYEAILREILVLEDGIRKGQEQLAQKAVFRDKIQRNLDKQSGGQHDLVKARRDLANQLHALFDDAVGEYRDQLRGRVEADASRFFLSMTTEADYAGLRINENYGLTIVHKDGQLIPVRSAGAEHVVALSLVAALQNNAPLRGPIFIDSPFGRLDGGHRERIVAALPDMADQVALLVYEDEMPPAKARDALLTRLRGEWKLERRSARHTVIVEQ
jgi:DNA sulfur modification protein DndD